MALTLIEKYPATAEGTKLKIKTRGVLTPHEKSLLASFFVLDDLMENDEKKELFTLCKSIYERDLWIQCDCLDETIKPVFRINSSSEKNLYIHRITSRKEHAESCLFKARTYENYDRSSASRRPITKRDEAFNLLGKKINGLLKPSDNPSAEIRDTGARKTKLARALFNILEAAELNVVSPENTLKPHDALLKAAKSLEIVNGISLNNYLELNPNRLKYRAILLKEDNLWKKGNEKHCLALLRIKDFNDEHIDVIFPDKTVKPVKIATRIYQSSGRFSERTSPYMALVLIGTTAESPWFYQPIKAYVMPTYSSVSYFPVDSFYEREVMRHLYRLYFNAKKHGSPFKIIKPLFDIEIPYTNDEESSFVLPDFLIKKGSKTLVLEVNGSIEPDYLERKSRTHKHMGRLGALISLNAYQAELENNLNTEIASVMNQITDWLRLS
jgi:hypothetical protein